LSERHETRGEVVICSVEMKGEVIAILILIGNAFRVKWKPGKGHSARLLRGFEKGNGKTGGKVNCLES